MPDLNPSTQDCYVEQAIAFVDILGFSNHVLRADHDLNFASSLLKALQTIQSYGQEEDFLSVSTFSDSIVLSIPLLSKPGLIVFDPFSSLFSTVLELTNILLRQGIIIRGAITIGKLYHENGLLFGPAMLNAVDLEKKLAKFPRTVAVGGHFNFGQAFFCREDVDGKLFIDFLGQSDIWKSPKWTLSTEHLGPFLLEARHHIVDGFQACAAEPKPQLRKTHEDKWRWLAQYFNTVAPEKGFPNLVISHKEIDFTNFSYSSE